MKDMKETGEARKADEETPSRVLVGPNREFTDLPHGAFTKIARRMRPKVSVQHVREVFVGNRTSPRVERAIEQFIKRYVDVAEVGAEVGGVNSAA